MNPADIILALSRPEGGKIEVASTQTGEKFVFSTSPGEKGHFVSVVRDGRYAYMGMLDSESGVRATRGSKVIEGDREMAIFRATWRILSAGRTPANATVREVKRRRDIANAEGKPLAVINAREDARATNGRFGKK